MVRRPADAPHPGGLIPSRQMIRIPPFRTQAAVTRKADTIPTRLTLMTTPPRRLTLRQRNHLLRLYGDFALRSFERAEPVLERDYDGIAVLMAVLQSNVSAVARDAALNRLYGDSPPPNELRLPVSLREAARLIAMPRERFRRKASLIARLGGFLPVGRGYIVPALVLRTPTARLHAQAARLLHRRLTDSGYPVAPVAVSAGKAPWRQGVLRVMGDVFVAWCRLASAPFGGDLRMAAVFSAVVQAGFAPDVEDGASPPRRVSLQALAGSLAMPRESVRRYVSRLEQDGWIARHTAGVAVSNEALGRSELDYVETLLDLTLECFRRLSDHGATFSADYLADAD